MKKFILFLLAVALGCSDTLFAADTILGKRTRSEVFSSDDELIEIKIRDSKDNVIVSLPIKIGVAKLSNLFAVELQNIDQEDAQNNELSIGNVMPQATLGQIIDLMSIYNQIEKENPESSDHGKIRLLYDYLEAQSLSEETLEKLLKALHYLDVLPLMNTVHLLLHNNCSQNDGAFIDPEFHPSDQPIEYTQRILLRYAASTPSRDELPSELIRMIPQSFKDINDLKSYLNHPIAQSFSHHSNAAMVRFFRDYITKARSTNSLPQLPQLMNQFQAQPESPLYIALFIEYYLQTNAQRTIAAQLPHASILSTVADRIRSFKANHDVDAMLDFSYMVSNELSSILGPLCQIIEPLCQRPLTILDLSRNQLTEVPAALGKLINLTWLDLSHNQLTSLPAELGSLTNLTELYLFYNQLNSLPATLGSLINLTYLNLARNQLTEVSAWIGNLTNLTQLALLNNQLTSLPTELGNLTNLKTLHLWLNHLTVIPAVLNRLGLFVIKDDHVVFAAE
jgi:hypothetical protein